MTKVKFTDNGNVKVTMTPEQWDILMSIGNHVRLGDYNAQATAFSTLMVDVETFNYTHGFGETEYTEFREDEDGYTFIELISSNEYD